ncbi:uncharacterized protein LOC131633094 [Vicia villosa]|uniref:uncharacterized protein LOC131633094 n=1 Tax=Vicia villosa TaxID=3911 RepID=UPI00273CDDA5|nr:uncharacterized protein LOC131633094 [Vicia villosa]
MNHGFGEDQFFWSSGSSSDDSSDDGGVDEYYWEKTITSGYTACRNVLHFPMEVCRFCRFFSSQIDLCDYDTGLIHECIILSATRNSEEALYIGEGWYQFARMKRLRRGDRLGFTISRFPYRLYVTLLKR